MRGLKKVLRRLKHDANCHVGSSTDVFGQRGPSKARCKDWGYGGTALKERFKEVGRAVLRGGPRNSFSGTWDSVTPVR